MCCWFCQRTHLCHIWCFEYTQAHGHTQKWTHTFSLWGDAQSVLTLPSVRRPVFILSSPCWQCFRDDVPVMTLKHEGAHFKHTHCFAHKLNTDFPRKHCYSIRSHLGGDTHLVPWECNNLTHRTDAHTLLLHTWYQLSLWLYPPVSHHVRAELKMTNGKTQKSL